VRSVKPLEFTRFLVTGGAGFIGRPVVDNLLSDPGIAVMVVDNLSVGLPMPAPRAGLQTINADIRDGDAMQRAFAAFSPEVVIHLAAIHHIPTCEARRAYALDVNVVGTETILEAAARARAARFVLASSGAVYAWEDGPLDEAKTPLRPADNYAIAKSTNETQARLWAERTGARAVIARIFNTIGRNDPNAHLVPDILRQIPSGARAAEIALGNLSPRRDYIHVEDTARALALLATAPLAKRIETFNVATGEDVSVQELVEMLSSVIGVDIAIRVDPARKRRVDRPSQLGGVGKIRQVLAFEPRRHLRDALIDIVNQVEWAKQAAQ
jgi:UDP-glucose 4-epimerase